MKYFLPSLSILWIPEIDYLITDGLVKQEQLAPFDKMGVEIMTDRTNKE